MKDNKNDWPVAMVLTSAQRGGWFVAGYVVAVAVILFFSWLVSVPSRVAAINDPVIHQQTER
jgi:hypothetical protein